ncbi:hypothetical protein CRM22_010068 [Opisthorchis felineus]|uniref:Selenocysteine lyase n=1 Tax=Opisthorchis felineus TaxID=147828 RepID=A0A4S2L2L6_OPIFE|nr:hypothetical protein CRM22_010068 [Opisthorchis felineus]TGZ56811.1 hypothetical protein CRM22_010068 [Opisthorchis felineus]
MAVYMDANSTTPLAPEVIKSIMKTAEKAWYNPSSSYDKIGKVVINNARKSIAGLLDIQCDDLVFTSGGTESNFMVFHTIASLPWGFLPHVITTNVEHPSILRPLAKMAKEGRMDLTIVPVDRLTGIVNPSTILGALRPNQTVLISLMLANNETGAIMPVGDVVRAVRDWEAQLYKSTDNVVPSSYRVFIHSDLAQAVGKLNVNIRKLGIDYGTIVGHKFYGPRIGALYIRGLHTYTPETWLERTPYRNVPTNCGHKDCCNVPPAPLIPLFLGGGQESGFRSGTENTPMIAGLAKAAELVSANLASYMSHMSCMREQLIQQLCMAFPPVSGHPNIIIFGVHRGLSSNLNGLIHLDPQRLSVLPNTVNLAFSGPPYLDSREILALCPNLCASRGAACHSDQTSSSVLLACGYSVEESRSAIRLSIGRDTIFEDIHTAVAELRAAVSQLFSSNSAAT